MNTLTMPSISYTALAPILFMLLGGVVIMAIAALRRQALSSVTTTGLTLVASVGALVFSLIEWSHVETATPTSTIAGALAVDGFSVTVAITVSCAVILATLFAHHYLGSMGISSAEYHVLALTAASGAMVMGAANDLVVVFLGLELLSIALYVLVALNRKSRAAEEAALKYFILGGFASAIFVFGIAFLYGATGSTNLQTMGNTLSASVAEKPAILLIGIALLLVGFCFKIAAVPFHLWTPDVYQGAPTPVTGFMAAVAKVGGFAALIRVLLAGLPTARSTWAPALTAIAMATLLGGALLMVVQRDAKRMLAYSSINHAGFLLVGLVASSGQGFSADLFYLFTYSVATLGTFGIITMVATANDDDAELSRLRGLATKHPVLGFSLSVLILTQAGVPLTTGFIAKFGVIEAAIGSSAIPLSIVAMVSAAIATFAYLRFVLNLYAAPEGDLESLDLNGSTTAAPAVVGVGIAVAVSIFFGVVPGVLYDLTSTAASHLLP
jgi:NADH-quinone oxidoreductase subunit N